MGSQRLDFRPASCDIYARPGSDLTFTVAVSGTGYSSAPTVTCDIGGQTPTTSVTLTAGVVLVTVALSDTQTTTLGSTGSTWSMLFTSGSTTTPILTGSYVGGTSGNTSQGMQVGVAMQTGAVSVQVLTSGGGGSGGGASALDDLTDVTITAAASGDILRHNGTAWVDAVGTTHFDAAGTAASAVAAHEADTTSVHGIANTASLLTTSSGIDDLSDVTITAAASGDILRHNGTAWVDAVGTTHFEVAGAVATHEADTTSVHGIADTSTLYRSGGTDVAVADGGTGASDAATARTNLGVDYTTLDERTRDTIGTALVAGTNVTITPNDGADTITIAASGGSAASRTAVNNAAYTVLTSDWYVAQTGTMSASRAWTLPAASAMTAGREIVFADESGTVTSTNTIVVTRAGSDTIDGATTATISYPYGVIRLVSDGTSKWTLLQEQIVRMPGLKSGRYYTLNGLNGSGGGARTAGDMILTPLWIHRAASIDRIGVKVTTLGASSVVRFGVYADDGYGYPGALIADFGAAPYSVTADASSTGDKDLIISPALALPVGLYWIAVVVQTAGCSLYNYVAIAPYPVSMNNAAAVTSGTSSGYLQPAVTGALPSTFTGTGVNASAHPAWWVRAV